MIKDRLIFDLVLHESPFTADCDRNGQDLRLRPPDTASTDILTNIRRKQHGRPCTRWEVARVWRLGRRQYILYADPEDPYEA